MKSEVVVVGSYVQDLTFRCENFPRPGQTTLGNMGIWAGGKGSNQAIACSRAGAKVHYVGAVGKDTFGLAARALYRSERISATLVEKPRHTTGSAAVMIDRSGQNQIVVALGANLALTQKDVPLETFRGTKIAICQFEVEMAVTSHVLKCARRAGALTLLNPAPMPRTFNREILQQVDILIPNENEFVALLRAISQGGKHRRFSEAKLHRLTDKTLHRLIRLLKVETVIVTLGSKGCFVSTKEKFCRIPAHRSIRVVDTTGAGDAFVGGFAAAFLKNGDIFRAAEFANAGAALSVSRQGATPSMPRKARVDRFLASTRSR